MASSLLIALGLEDGLPSGQILTINENDTSDGSFILSSLMCQEIKNNHKLIFVLFHNSLGHYHNIGQKFGYSLFSLQESEDLFVIDILQKIGSACKEEESLNEPISLKNIYLHIRQQVMELAGTAPICLIMENVSNLLLLDYSLQQVAVFVHYIRTLMQDTKQLSIAWSAHNFEDCNDFKSFLTGMEHISDVIVNLNDLKTGKAIDVTGTFTVRKTQSDVNKWNEQCEYHYKLYDKSIKVFAPGHKESL